MSRGILAIILSTMLVVACGDDDTETTGGVDTGAGGSGATGGSDVERQEARTFAGWKAINDSLAMYGPLNEEFVPTMGIHWGVEGPHLTVAVAENDIVSAVELIVPAGDGWLPWFDQDEGEPMNLPGIGDVYTQHIWITEIGTVNEGQEPTLLPLTLDALTEANPALEGYERLSDYVPQMGIHYGMQGPSVVLAVSEEGQLNAFELIVPEAQGWHPWFDQPEGEPMELEGMGMVYTQHLYVVEPSTLD